MENTRSFWLESLLHIADPVLHALANGRLRTDLPLYHHPDADDRAEYTYLEALGRTLTGLAPWLEHPADDPAEEALRRQYAALARQALTVATDPHSPDYLNFEKGFQPIVDAAFLAQALLRAPQQLFFALPQQARARLVACLKATRTRKPFANNWLLFSGVIEAFLATAGEADWDAMRIDYALRQHAQWYLGDGVYGDGPAFHFDYYNSFVIHPMLCDILNAVGGRYPDWEALRAPVFRRAQRFAGVLEQLIAPDGSYPVVGRSACYRFGAFHALAQAALLENLPEALPPAQVRCGLTAVVRRVLACPGVFDENGWLTIGVAGRQPSLGETYISTGSLYLAAAVFLPLGLPQSHAFWSAPAADWTQKRLWNGEDLPAGHSLADR